MDFDFFPAKIKTVKKDELARRIPAAVPDPVIPDIVAPRNSVTAILRAGAEQLSYLSSQLRRHALIRIKLENPVTFNLFKRPVPKFSFVNLPPFPKQNARA